MPDLLPSIARSSVTMTVAIIALTACGGSRTRTSARSSPVTRTVASTVEGVTESTSEIEAPSTAVRLSGMLTNTNGDNYRFSISGDLGSPEASVANERPGFLAVERAFAHSTWTVENQRADRSALFDASNLAMRPMVLYGVYPASSRTCALSLYYPDVRTGPTAVPRTGEFCDIPIATVRLQNESEPDRSPIPARGSRSGPMSSYQAPELGSVQHLPRIPVSKIGPILSDMRARPPVAYAVVVLGGGSPFGQLPAVCDLASTTRYGSNPLLFSDELLFTGSSSTDGAMVQHTC
jgi:hypothetical protein